MSDASVIDRLHATVLSRRGAAADSSYTARLFSQGRAKIAAKLGEEAVETVIAGMGEAPERLASESADLLYHLVVLWAERGVAPVDVWAELARREGTSGLDEKANRGKA